MNEIIEANASPEKRLFISLLTRDISLADAITDLIDNSTNAAIAPLAPKLNSAAHYIKLLDEDKTGVGVNIELTVSTQKITLKDNASGIPASVARDHVFAFGRPAREKNAKDSGDRLSVYGIGLKRAIFKLGNKISMDSDHVDGGFSLRLDVSKWERLHKSPWTFEITKREKSARDACGTTIEVTELSADVVRRISDGIFMAQLRDRIARTYAFYLSSLVNISVNGDRIDGVDFRFGENHASDEFQMGGVSCNIGAGIGVSMDVFRGENSGWFVFCNGRTVIHADKTSLTGWEGGGQLPLFQPKHRPFLGIVFFFAQNPEELPWTTTKASVNQESGVWQEAKKRMIVVGREVTSVLDRRYSNDGTEMSSADLKLISGAPLRVLEATSTAHRTFSVSATETSPETKVQYWVKKEDIKKIAGYLRKPRMSAAEVGRYTFDFFIKTKIGEDE
jgi:hypothetical protein